MGLRLKIAVVIQRDFRLGCRDGRHLLRIWNSRSESAVDMGGLFSGGKGCVRGEQ